MRPWIEQHRVKELGWWVFDPLTERMSIVKDEQTAIRAAADIEEEIRKTTSGDE